MVVSIKEEKAYLNKNQKLKLQTNLDWKNFN